MINSLFKHSLRTLNRQKGYFLINITGLSIGIACSLIIALFIIHELSYDQAAINLFNSENKNIALYGILIRDTQVNERDLSLPGAAFRRDFSNPTTCQLTALYLPWGIDELITKIRNGGAS